MCGCLSFKNFYLLFNFFNGNDFGIFISTLPLELLVLSSNLMIPV
jgi:hypothetical protein